MNSFLRRWRDGSRRAPQKWYEFILERLTLLSTHRLDEFGAHDPDPTFSIADEAIAALAEELLSDAGAIEIPGDPVKVLENIRRIAAADAWTPARTASVVLCAAAVASTQGRQELGLAILANLERTDATFASEHRFVINDLHAQICIGIAVNALKAGIHGIAAEAYLHAFRASMNNADDSRALYALRAAEDVVSRSAGDELIRVVAVLSMVALEAEGLGSAGVRTIQRICSKLSARMTALQRIDSTEFFFVHQIAKGLRFDLRDLDDPAAALAFEPPLTRTDYSGFSSTDFAMKTRFLAVDKAAKNLVSH